MLIIECWTCIGSTTSFLESLFLELYGINWFISFRRLTINVTRLHILLFLSWCLLHKLLFVFYFSLFRYIVAAWLIQSCFLRLFISLFFLLSIIKIIPAITTTPPVLLPATFTFLIPLYRCTVHKTWGKGNNRNTFALWEVKHKRRSIHLR